MIIVWKSRPKIGIQEVVGTYEFSSLPGSMLVADGTLLRFSCKTALWNTFKKLPVNLDGDNDSAANQSKKTVEIGVTVVDAISEVQCMDKPEWIKDWLHIAVKSLR